MEPSPEWVCSLCLETFKNPVRISCGHNFCQACLSQRWQDSDERAPCPQCGQIVPRRNFKPNGQLARLAEAAKKHEAEGKEGGCAEQERPREHHHPLPREDVDPENKEQIEANLQSLEDRRNRLASWILAENHESEECLKQLEMVKQKISSAFDEMQNFLKEKECFWLDRLQDLEKSIMERKERNVSKLSEEKLHLSYLIAKMNEELQQPADKFLQDIKRSQRRFQKKQPDRALSLLPGLEKRLITFSQKASTLEKAMKKHKDSLEWKLTKAWSPKQVVGKVNVTLDPDTANAFLVLSKNLKDVVLGEEEQNLPNVPERFDWEPCVLGRDRFTSGNPWWEVTVKEEGEMWALGVARETINRKRHFIPSPSEGIWAIGKPSGGSFSSYELWALTSPKPTLLTLKHIPRKILVSLLYEEGCVEFFDAESDELIFTFSSASFSGEIICPFFWVAPGVRLKC